MILLLAILFDFCCFSCSCSSGGDICNFSALMMCSSLVYDYQVYSVFNQFVGISINVILRFWSIWLLSERQNSDSGVLRFRVCHLPCVISEQVQAQVQNTSFGRWRTSSFYLVFLSFFVVYVTNICYADVYFYVDVYLLSYAVLASTSRSQADDFLSIKKQNVRTTEETQALGTQDTSDPKQFGTTKFVLVINYSAYNCGYGSECPDDRTLILWHWVRAVSSLSCVFWDRNVLSPKCPVTHQTRHYFTAL